MHKGKVVAEKDKYKVIDCEICGFKHLDPIPTEERIKKFYKNKYFDLVKKGGRAPEIRRLMKGGKESKAELKWLESTLYNDINTILGKHLSRGSRNLCDIGCGTGNFLKYMKKKGWEGIGIEPSQEGARRSEDSELTIYNLSLEEFINAYPESINTFDAVTLLNVLEHVPYPINFLQNVKRLLKPRTGMICIRVPNDFNMLQIYVQKKLNKEAWWIAVPDHINYFNLEALKKLLISLGFNIVYATADFPMEIFLLMGDDYIGNHKIGNICHRKRVNFELLMPESLRREIYQSLAKIGIGRDSIVFARSK
ncbi:MAG: class I SAM-dependent methyltransferase [Candidatus Omnitrophica bacterium]|nr:class I SAM-dependent methyltransferase [Candidatus Omnitrophota bacterium]